MEWRLEIFLLTKKEYSDWRESLTFKQALYPYRVGKDMHNPSKMHMNFPSSNSSRLNSSQWINYEYCMHRSMGDQIEFTVKRKTKNKPAILEYPSAGIKEVSLKSCFCAKLWKKSIQRSRIYRSLFSGMERLVLIFILFLIGWTCPPHARHGDHRSAAGAA